MVKPNNDENSLDGKIYKQYIGRNLQNNLNQEQ